MVPRGDVKHPFPALSLLLEGTDRRKTERMRMRIEVTMMMRRRMRMVSEKKMM